MTRTVSIVSAPTVLVTGACGFIAQQLIGDLLASGRRVLGVDNFDPFYSRGIKAQNLARLRSLAKPGHGAFSFIEAPVQTLEASELKELGVTSVIHLAARAGVRSSIADPLGYLQPNLQSTLAALELARELKVESFVYASSSSVYGDKTQAPFREDAVADQPVSPYAAMKRSGELFCRLYADLYGLKIAAIRLFSVYGPFQRPDLAVNQFMHKILDGEELSLFGDGQSERDYTYVSDVSQGAIKAHQWLETAPSSTFEIFNIGSSQPVKLRELVEKIERTLKVKARIRHLPDQVGDVRRTYADLEKARRLLGYSPKVSLDEGLQLSADWIRSRRRKASSRAA